MKCCAGPIYGCNKRGSKGCGPSRNNNKTTTTAGHRRAPSFSLGSRHGHMFGSSSVAVALLRLFATASPAICSAGVGAECAERISEIEAGRRIRPSRPEVPSGLRRDVAGQSSGVVGSVGGSVPVPFPIRRHPDLIAAGLVEVRLVGFLQKVSSLRGPGSCVVWWRGTRDGMLMYAVLTAAGDASVFAAECCYTDVCYTFFLFNTISVATSIFSCLKTW